MRTYIIIYYANYTPDFIYRVLKEFELNTDKVFNLSLNRENNSISFKASCFNYNNYLRFITEADFGDVADVKIVL